MSKCEEDIALSGGEEGGRSGDEKPHVVKQHYKSARKPNRDEWNKFCLKSCRNTIKYHLVTLKKGLKEKSQSHL